MPILDALFANSDVAFAEAPPAGVPNQGCHGSSCQDQPVVEAGMQPISRFCLSLSSVQLTSIFYSVARSRREALLLLQPGHNSMEL